MNARQESKLNMFRTVEKHVDDNPSVVAAVPAFQTAFTKFKTKIARIIDTEQQKDVNLTGISADKQVSKQQLCERATDVAQIVSAFASATGDNTLKQEVNFSLTALQKTRDDQLAPRCQNIHDRAQTNLAALADYGITAAMLANLQTAIQSYAARAPQPRAAVSNRKTLQANLENLFKEADEILTDQMDDLVPALKTAHPDWVQTYQSAREILDPPSKSKTPTDPATGKKADDTPKPT